MSQNKKALIRYRAIDKCLQNRGRKWTFENIKEKVEEALFEDNQQSSGVSRSQLFADLYNMKHVIYEAPIKRIKDGKTSYYTYDDPNYSINNQPLSETEAGQLKSAIMVLSRFKGMPQFDWLHEIVPVIESKMGLLKTEKEIISFESNIDYSGAKHISVLFNAIINKRAISLLYQDFKSPVSYLQEIHPQYLKQYNSRWFIMSLMEKWGDKPQIHALDRIKEIKEIPNEYRDLKNFDWDYYFSDMIGVSRTDKALTEIKLLILDAEQASYIDTKPLHESQKKITKVESGYETSIDVIPNYELEKLLLSFGERIKVLAPSDLIDSLRGRVKKMVKNYEE